jgi:two-component system, LytTR family, sensor kinase
MGSAPASPRLSHRWGLIALPFTLVGLLNFFIQVTSWRAEGQHLSAKYALLWEMTGVYTLLALMPAILPFIERHPITRRTFAIRLPLHLAVFVAFAACHTLLMWGTRNVAYALLGWGRYDYGDMRFRFFMEGGKQLVAYSLVYAVVALLRYTRRAREREVEAARLERELTEARLSALKMQLNPHFLFNTLNMISSHVREDPGRAEAMIAHLSDFLRMTLRHAQAQEVALATELQFLEAYLEIMKARFEDRLEVELCVEEGARPALVPHLVLQPLVENAVTHAMRDHRQPGRLRLSARRVGERLVLAVEDNGPGLAAGGGGGSGIGLTNTAERLRRLYGDDHRMALATPNGGGLRLEIEVPYRREAVPVGEA